MMLVRPHDASSHRNHQKYLTVLCLVFVAAALAEDRATLVVQQSIQDDRAIVGHDLTIVLQVYNIGSSSAHEVSLIDDNFKDNELFEPVAGLSTAKFDRILSGPENNVSHTMIVKPLKEGEVVLMPAIVTYKPAPSAELVTGYSTDLHLRVLSRIKGDRVYSSHIREWSIFVALILIPLSLPFILWFYAKKNYVAQSNQKNK